MNALTLRPYQEEAVGSVEEALERDVRRPLVGLPTGTGKTVVFSEVIRRREGEGPALVLAHRDELLMQAADKIRQIKPDSWIGLVKAGANEWNLPVVVGSVQTLCRPSRLEQIPRGYFKTVIVDEAHHATAYNTYGEILDYLDAPLTLGVTATPERADKVALGSVWDEIVYHRGMLEMIEQGYLCDLKGLQVKLRRFNVNELRVKAGDFQDGQAGRALVEADAPTHAARAYVQHAAGRKALLFTPTVELAYLMAEEFQRQGIPAEALDGKTSTPERRAMLDRFHSGETLVLANCAVLTEGYDEPSVDCVIIAKPTRSRVSYIQMVGRGVRPYPGKDDCLVLDLVGNSDRLDLVTLPRLFGVDAKDAEEGVLYASTVQAGQVIGQVAATATAPDDGELEAKTIDLFSGKKALHWLQVGETWTLSIGAGFISLERGDTGWRTAVHEWGGAGKSQLSHRVLGEGLDLGFAQGVGEDFARKIGALTLAHPEASWRKHPISDKQKAQLAQLGIAFEDAMTKGAASDLISAAFARRRLNKAGVGS